MKQKAWGILTRENEEIGGGERERKYVYWDKEEAEAFIAEHGEIGGNPVGWKVVPVTITYEL